MTAKPRRRPRGRVETARAGGGSRVFVMTGRERAPFRDVYHVLLTMSWPVFITVTAAGYLGVNVIFAGLYLLDCGGIANAVPGSFWDAFFFSVQTLVTLGYGVMAPTTMFTNALMTLETFFGLFNLAMATGLMFARFSRPTARIMFSRSAVISDHQGVPTLMFRTANQRKNQILQAEMTVSLLRQITTREGEEFRRIDDLKLVRARTPMFVLSWMVMHRIDATSPLHGLTEAALRDIDLEIVALISGIDETVSQPVYSRHSYSAADIRWDHRLVDIIELQGGQRTVRYERFHDVEPVEPRARKAGVG